MHEIARKAYIALGCSGMARVDFFLSPVRGWVINEINTLPGFTRISLYPQMMGQQGIAYPDLVEKLIALAIEKYSLKTILKTSLTD